MKSVTADAPRPPEWRLETNGPLTTLHLSGDWLACETGVRSALEVRQILEQSGTAPLRVDASEIARWDSAFIAFLKMLRDSGDLQPRPIQIDEARLPQPVRRLLALAVAADRAAAEKVMSRRSVTTQVGEACFATLRKGVDITALVGQTALRGAASIVGRTHARPIDLFELVRDAGAGALGIVAIVNVLVGAILAFVGAIQLRRFGADLYVANLVGIAVVREMAAMVTAVVIAGRTGGAYAAELATMQGNEEIDALNVIGIRIFDFLVLPRVLALVAMMPLLYLYGCAAGLMGGLVAGVATLDLTPTLFLQQLRGAVALTQFEIGVAKSVFFGALVALAACHIGLSAGRSAADVGRAATAAVVTGIIGIIALDAVFAVCTNALRI